MMNYIILEARGQPTSFRVSKGTRAIVHRGLELFSESLGFCTGLS